MFVLALIVAAFPDAGVGGHPAGVVVDANGLSTAQKQAVARRMGLPATGFVSASTIASLKLDYFTPTRQIAHCGCATVATFYLLRRLGLIADGRLSEETADGTRRVLVDGEMVFMERSAPDYRPIEVGSELGDKVLAALALSPDQLAGGPGPSVIGTGGDSFLVVPLADERSVARLRPDLDRVEDVCAELDVIGFYPFCSKARGVGRHAAACMFAPRSRLPEETATATAAGALARFLHDQRGIDDRRILIEQGRLMQPPSPSLITVDLEIANGSISGLLVGGTARLLSSRRIEVWQP